MEVLPTMTPRDAPVVRAVALAIERVLGRPAELVASPGTYDQKHVQRIGGLEDCIAYGPGILELAHQPDEYVGDRRPGGRRQGDGGGDAHPARGRGLARPVIRPGARLRSPTCRASWSAMPRI